MQTNNGKKQAKRRQSHKARNVRIQLTMSDGLLELVDKAAEQDFTNRSDIIRTAVLWYLRPQGRDLKQVEPDEILKTLQHCKALVGMREMLKDVDVLND
jgi:hypothetical protein